jgi:hypothetical protein
MKMKTRMIFVTLAFCFCGAIAGFAADLNQGTWKLNESKSKISAGAPKNTSVVYSMDGDNVKAVVEGMDSAGKPTHNEWVGKYDGKYYPVTGDGQSDARAIKQVDDHNFDLSAKKGDKVTVSGKIKISADGKTRTVSTSGTDEKGKKVSNTSVYEKQ